MEASNDNRGPDVKLSENPTAEEIDQFFRHDTFAYQQAECRITEARKGHGVAEMVIDPTKHLNAEGYVMGGALFTLADYAFAAATMPGATSSVSLTSTIEFIKGTQGGKLIATCDVDRSGRKVGFYTINVTDDQGDLVAKVVTTCYRPI